jgi:hypothetical protein
MHGLPRRNLREARTASPVRSPDNEDGDLCFQKVSRDHHPVTKPTPGFKKLQRMESARLRSSRSARLALSGWASSDTHPVVSKSVPKSAACRLEAQTPMGQPSRIPLFFTQTPDSLLKN